MLCSSPPAPSLLRGSSTFRYVCTCFYSRQSATTQGERTGASMGPYRGTRKGPAGLFNSRSVVGVHSSSTAATKSPRSFDTRQSTAIRPACRTQDEREECHAGGFQQCRTKASLNSMGKHRHRLADHFQDQGSSRRVSSYPSPCCDRVFRFAAHGNNSAQTHQVLVLSSGS